MGRINSRSKGARAERELAKKFAKWWGADFARTPSSGGFSTKKFREDWNAAGDLVTPDESFPFCVESKHVEGWHLEQLLTAPECDIIQWWRQTVGETPEGKAPLLVFRKNHHPHLFMMTESSWRYVTQHRSDVTPAPLFYVDGVLVRVGLLEEFMKVTPDEWRQLND